MAFEEDLITGLLDSLGLPPLIGDRLSWIMRNRGEGLPAITIDDAAQGRAYSHQGAINLEGPRVQFDIWGETQTSVVAVRKALIVAVEGLAGQTHGQTTFKGAFLVMAQDWTKQDRGDGDPDSRSTLHFTIWHQPAA